MRSRCWLILALMAIVSVVLSSCAAASPTVVPQPTITKVPDMEATLYPGVTKITIFVGFGTGTSPEVQAVYKKLTDEFNTTHRDVQIQFLIVPYSERFTKFSAMLASDTAPDLVMPIGVGGIAEFYDEWADLTPYLLRDNYDMSRFLGKTVEIHNYGEKGVLGLPMCVYPSVLYYNKDLFDAANVQYPPHKFGEKYADGGAWDYNKVVEIARKLSLDTNGNDANSPNFDAKNMKQWGFDGWDWGNNVEWAAKWGDLPGTIVSLDKKKSLLGSQQYMDWMTFNKDLMWTWHVRPTSAQGDGLYVNSGDPFGSGMVGMWEIQSWIKYAWPGWDKSFTWDIAAVPQGPDGKILSMVDADTFVIPKSGKHRDQAWEVVKWFFKNENLQKLIDSYGCFPADKDLASRWVANTSKDFPNVDLQVLVDALYYAENVNHEAWRPQYTRINEIAARVNEQISSGENLDVNALMKGADKEVQDLLDAYWANHK